MKPARPTTPGLASPLPAGAKLLGWQRICNIDVPVVRASSANCAALRDDDGAALDGRFDAETGYVFVHTGLSESLERDAVNHELLHALLYFSGAQRFLHATTSFGDRIEHEEILIRILAPHIAGIRWAQ